MAPRRPHRSSPICIARAEMDCRATQVHEWGDDRADVLCLGAQEPHGGAHRRASGRCKTALDWAAKGGPCDTLLPWYVPILLPLCSALTQKALCGVRDKGGGYAIPAVGAVFEMLGSLRKEVDGAIGIALLNYCEFSFQRDIDDFSLIVVI
jgi:hypothetical protein